MKRTPLSRGTKQLKRTPLKRGKSTLKRTKIRIVGQSTTAELKREIQALVRQIVMKRDGGCVIRDLRPCGGVLGTVGVVFQADHLITRSNSATYADTRLIVCVCKGCHMWKKFHKEDYDVLVKTVLSKERVKLWDDSLALQHIPKRVGAYDWKLAIVALKQELSETA